MNGGDPRNMLGALFFEAAGEITKLMDGFYNNIEDGLFELAFANKDAEQQRSIIELMRELRFRRQLLMRTFMKRMQQSGQDWITQKERPEYLQEQVQAEQVAKRCAGHFTFLLQSIAERVAYATDREPDREALPMSPERISYQFIMSCRSVKFDRAAVEVVQDLFHRFVLERLGTVYAEMNEKLEDAGCLTERELTQLSASTA